MKLKKTILLACILALSSCSEPSSLSDQLNLENVRNADDAYTATEVDEMVEDIWFDSNGGKPVPLDLWLGEDEDRELEWISREEAIVLFNGVKAAFNVNLCAVSEPDVHESTLSLVAKVDKVEDKRGLKRLFARSSSTHKVEIEFGHKWVTVDGELTDEGEYILHYQD